MPCFGGVFRHCLRDLGGLGDSGGSSAPFERTMRFLSLSRLGRTTHVAPSGEFSNVIWSSAVGL